MAVEDCLSRTSCPIARQMLGCTTTMAGLYHGTGRDIPLRLWLSDKLGVGADAATWPEEPGLGFELRKDDLLRGQLALKLLEAAQGLLCLFISNCQKIDLSCI